MNGRLPGYTWIENPNRGTNQFEDQGGPIILLHMTVTTDMSPSSIAGHTVPPHLWANPYTGTKYQTQDLNYAAKALYQQQYGISWTNRHFYCIQTELIGVPVVSTATYSDAQCRWIAENVIVPIQQWLIANGTPANLDNVKYHQNTGGSASEYWSGRMSDEEFSNFSGVCAHIDVPFNDHWDCSAERIDKMVSYAREILGNSGDDDVLTKDQDDRLIWLRQFFDKVDISAINLLRDVYNQSRNADMYSHANNWHLGNFLPTAGRENETVSSMMRDLVKKVNALTEEVAEIQTKLDNKA